MGAANLRPRLFLIDMKALLVLTGTIILMIAPGLWVNGQNNKNKHKEKEKEKKIIVIEKKSPPPNPKPPAKNDKEKRSREPK